MEWGSRSEGEGVRSAEVFVSQTVKCELRRVP